MSYPYHMGLWDKAQHEATMRRIAKRQQEALAAYLRRQQFAGTNSARAAVSTCVVAPENPGTVSLTPHAADGAGLGFGQGRLF